ncbi:MAG: hypothetical protein IJ327_07475 [Lachnospiraceae bacterium]|nr:hypothetical protein [Lachnospiraceae bacterium]
MKNKRDVYVRLENRENNLPVPILCRKSKEAGGVLQGVDWVVLDSRNATGVYQLNMALVSPADYERLQGKDYALVNPENGRYDRIILKADAKVPTDGDMTLRTVAGIKKRLGYRKEQGPLLLCAMERSVGFADIRRQSLENVRDDNLVMSAGVYDSLVKDSPFTLFDVVNGLTGDSFCIHKEHIIRTEPSEDKEFLQLNRKHRIFLKLEGDQSVDAKEAGIYLRPELSSLYYKRRCNLWNLLTKLFVGKSALSLMCRRPFECDESSDIVRISGSNMKLLGVEEIDSVILRYHTRTVKCRVLEMDDRDEFATMNGENGLMPDLSIGIPAHIRNKLGITYVDCAVKVERDTDFLFAKSLPEQIIPLLLTFTTSGLVLNMNIAFEIFFAIVVVYLNFSSKRHMRSS